MNAETKTIVALIALPEEHDVFQKIFTVIGDHSTDRTVRLEHDAGRSDVRLISVLAEQMGSQSALFSTDGSISDFEPNLIVVVGIAGGISNDLTVGDVCIANEVIDVLHNAKITEVAGKTEIAFAPDFYNVDAELVSSFTFLRVHPTFKKMYMDWRTEGGLSPDAIALGDAVRADGPEIHLGPLACGPVVASEQFNAKLKALHRKLMAVETESGGVFGRLSRSNVPAISIRGISDMADSDKAELERRTQGGARRLAMENASRLFQQQIKNERFINVAIRHKENSNCQAEDLFPKERAQSTVVSEIDADIRSRLAERSAEFKAKPSSFYLPIPRARRINYADDLADADVSLPENIVECLVRENRVLVRLPRSYPSQALGWSLAHSLIRQPLDGKVVLPYVISGDAILLPSGGIDANLPKIIVNVANRSEFERVIIIEEPPFHSRARMRFLVEQLEGYNARVLVLTKSEDSISALDDFVKDAKFKEYEMAPVSFTETAFFLEKTFDMTAREAEAVAIRLDDTFRKFRLDAHPTYFAGLQEETLAALINANKRAELIQLAVDALLSLMVAADKSKPPLSRTTRERFLKSLVIRMASDESPVDDATLLDIANKFLKSHLFSTPAPDFLNPFFDIGLLYRSEDRVFFTHPYLKSYLLAQALRDNPDLAARYFDAKKELFDYYAFDLYCEMGPSCSVVENVVNWSVEALEVASVEYPSQHVYLESEERITALSSPRQLVSLTGGLMGAAEKLERDDPTEQVRSEKQRLLDARRHVRSEVGARNPTRQDELPEDIKREFEILDALSRALGLCATAVGSGSESLEGSEKVRLANLVLKIGNKFSDIWTRNRLRTDFGKLRNDVLADENIWKMLDQFGADDDQFESVKTDLQMYIHGFELNAMVEPMGRVLWRIAASAGVRVLMPVVEQTKPDNEVERILRSAWMIEVDPEKGRDYFKHALADYSGSALMRIVLASHLLWRVFWHHYKTAGSRHFVNSAKRALRPLGLAPTDRRIEDVKKGARIS